jgi:hypothetical protein
MKNAKLRIVGLSIGLACFGVSVSAFAQTATAQAGVQGQVGMGLPGATPQTTATVAPATAGTDHSLVVGHLGVGYLGRSTIPVGSTPTDVNAPIIGVRYWMDPNMGLDLGLGFDFDGGSTSPGDDAPSHWAVLLHGGVPLALASGRHYTFEIIPEANLGFGGGSTTQGGTDISNHGFLLDLGARAGAEIQFGFIGIPELSLQASVGAMFSYVRSSSSSGGQTASTKEWMFHTTVYNSPWSIFTSNVAAFYYF